MESTRLHRLLLGLVVALACQLSATAQVSATDEKSAADKSDELTPTDSITPRERPRLKDNEVVSLKRRLEVHGGMSFTYGWASGGRNFREAGAWVSYFDPETGLGLSVGFSQSSGNMPYSYGYYPYGYDLYDRGGWFYGSPRSAYDVDLTWSRPNFSLGLGFSQADFSGRNGFDGSGAYLHGPVGRRF